jgi:UDP-N-acetylmuramyl pentapeptide phosphotransferase/UDP-N-acetylglucosamine-1-phosphate transferase
MDAPGGADLCQAREIGCHSLCVSVCPLVPDHDLSGPQKMHVKAIPRVGGVGIFAGLVGGSATTMWRHTEFRAQTLSLMACLLPVFLSCLLGVLPLLLLEGSL